MSGASMPGVTWATAELMAPTAVLVVPTTNGAALSGQAIVAAPITATPRPHATPWVDSRTSPALARLSNTRERTIRLMPNSGMKMWLPKAFVIKVVTGLSAETVDGFVAHRRTATVEA